MNPETPGQSGSAVRWSPDQLRILREINEKADALVKVLRSDAASVAASPARASTKAASTEHQEFANALAGMVDAASSVADNLKRTLGSQDAIHERGDGGSSSF